MRIPRIAALALCAALCSTSALASEHTGWVYNGLLGQASLHADGLDDSRFASNSSIGYRWGAIGVELGHTMAFGRFRDSLGAGAYDVDARLGGWNGGVNFNHDFTPAWGMQAHAGAFAWDARTRVTDSLGARTSVSDSGNDWYAGASLDYSHERKSYGVGYTRYKAGEAHMDLWGFHSEFRF
jgi:hypothetical protein